MSGRFGQRRSATEKASKFLRKLKKLTLNALFCSGKHRGEVWI